MFLIIIVVFSGIKLAPILKPMLGFNEKELKSLDMIDFNSSNKEESSIVVKGFSSYIAKYDGGKISLYNHKGDLLWEKDKEIKEPLIIGSDDFFIVADMLSGTMDYFDYSGNTLATINLEDKIYNGKIFHNNSIAVALEGSNTILLLDEVGQEISSISIPKGDIIDFELSNNGDIIAVALLNVEEYDYYSSIFLYSLEGRVLAGNKIEKSILYYLKFDENDNIFSLGDNVMIMIAQDEGLLWEKEIEETINAIDSMGYNRIVINSIKSQNTIIDTKNRNSIIQMNLDGEIIHQTPITGEIIGVKSSEDVIAAFSKRTIFLIDDKGDIFIERKINRDIEDVLWISDGTFVLMFKDRMEIMTLNY